MTTLADLETLAGIEVLDHLDRTISVPVLTGPQCQGDLIVLPDTIAGLSHTTAARTVPAAGVPVLRGEAMGNTHLLVADGTVTWAPSTDAQDLGVVTVGDDATGWLLHPEHGASGIGPGRYTIRRQREQADEIRLVAD